jgi:3-oxoacyl-ACP reductase-like protein
MGKPLGKKPLGRSRTRWDDEMKMDLTKRGYQVAKYQQC